MTGNLLFLGPDPPGFSWTQANPEYHHSQVHKQHMVTRHPPPQGHRQQLQVSNCLVAIFSGDVPLAAENMLKIKFDTDTKCVARTELVTVCHSSPVQKLRLFPLLPEGTQQATMAMECHFDINFCFSYEKLQM